MDRAAAGARPVAVGEGARPGRERGSALARPPECRLRAGRAARGSRQLIGTRSRPDRKSVVSGKSVSVRVDLGGRRIIKKKTHNKSQLTFTTHCSKHIQTQRTS